VNEDKLVEKTYPNGAKVKYGLRHFNPGYLSRTGQYSIDKWRETLPCRFHNDPDSQPVLKEYPDVTGGMVLQGATSLSHNIHGLVRPMNSCWSEGKIRKMSGVPDLWKILHAICLPKIKTCKYVRLVHYNGTERCGASVPDFHIHLLMEPDPDELFDLETELEMVEEFRKSKMALLFAGHILAVVESIHQVGQCFFVQTDDKPINMENLSFAIYTIIRLYSKAFANTAPGKEGLPPDFQLMLEFREGRLWWGSFTPQLAGVGAEQCCGIRMGPTPHQWTPKETLQLLRLANA